MTPLKHSQTAKHLFMSDRNLYDVEKALKIDMENMTLDEIRGAYILHLREGAAGRSGSHVLDAAAAKTENLKIDSDLKRLTLMERMGEVLPRQETEQEIITHIISARQEFENNLPDKLAHEIKIIYRFDIPAAFFQTIIRVTLHNFSEKMMGMLNTENRSELL